VAFADRSSNPRHSLVAGKKIFVASQFLSGLYHPRALFDMVDLNQPQRPAELQQAASSASDRPYTTPDAWLYRDLFSGTCDSLHAWPADAVDRVQSRSLAACIRHYRTLVPDDGAQKIDCTVATSTGKVKIHASHLAKHQIEDQA
jgi:hypothetical protein